jgi:hypothetical protein
MNRQVIESLVATRTERKTAKLNLKHTKLADFGSGMHMIYFVGIIRLTNLETNLPLKADLKKIVVICLEWLQYF